MPSGATIRVLLLHDGKPGHYNQSDGIVAALARSRSVNVERIEVSDSGLLPARAVRSIVSAGTYALVLTERLAGTSGITPQHKPDIVVSSGGQTLIANLLLARRYRCKNIFSGSLRGLPTSLFSAVLHVDPKLEHTQPYIIGLKPSAVEPTDRRRIAGVFGKAGLLVGGPTKTHEYSACDLQRMLDGLSVSELDWEIMTSRRTPPLWADSLAEVSDSISAALFDYRETGPGGVSSLLSRVDFAVITDDSVSMISEAIAARLPVVSLTAAETGPLSDQAYLDLLRTRKWYRPLAMENFSDALLTEAARDCAPMQDNHIDVLAAGLDAKIPDLSD